ncbi:MAG: isopentenyl-diphosphate Delta-isomerase [Gemmatimonadota bacterium]|nr:isopentenyl-diphosphate Delta-isomerase [Gemmatimonadota bacterium]
MTDLCDHQPPEREDSVVLVDALDNELGTAPLLQAHREGALHRAVSIFLYDRAGRMLIQRRAAAKYHSGGLWSNTACTHPRPGENPHRAAQRRLGEEMGLETPLNHAFVVLYHADVGEGLIEHELDHIYTGTTSRNPDPDPREVMDWRWITPGELRLELQEQPGLFTPWFRLIAPRLLERGGAGE